MKKRFFILLAIFTLSAFMAYSGVKEDKMKAEELIKRGVKYIKKVGEKKAFDAFTQKDGGFIDGEFYIFVVDFNGDTLAHGGNPKLKGKNMLELKDPTGKYFIKEFIKLAKAKGSGWVDYKWSNPESKKLQKKSSYIQKMEGKNYFLGCGIYLK